MLRIAALLLVLIGLATTVHGTGLRRKALWLVVGACAADHTVTGASFPCLAVAGDAGDGYIVLRSPLDPDDTIVSPTRRVVGLEAPALQGDDGARYFSDAYQARAFIPGFADERPGRAILLGVNSALARTQDQLHIHIGFAAPRVETWIASAADSLAEDRWTRIDTPVRGVRPWARWIAGNDLSAANPFALTAALAKTERLPLDDMFVAAAAIRASDGRTRFLLLAGESSQPGWRGDFDVGRFIASSRGRR